MTDSERITLLEAALIRYVELFGFIEESRRYYIKIGAAGGRPS